MASIKAESMKVFGMVRIPGSKDQVIKVELKRYNGTVGVDIRGWYRKDEDKLTDADKAAQDAKGYLPGKGIFMNPIVAEWLVKKIHEMGKDDTFLAAVKDAKAGAKTAEHTDAAAAKLAKENEDLKAKLAEQEARMAKLEAMMAAAAAPKAEAAVTAEAVEDLEEVTLPESSTTNPRRNRRNK